MHQPEQWWKGFGLAALLGIAGAWARTDTVEQDLLAKAVGATKSAAPDTASALKLSVDGRDIYVDGPDFGAGEGARVGQAVAEQSGVRLVSTLLTRVPTPKPYVFSASHNGPQFTLTGSAPTPAERDKLIIAARVVSPGVAVVDNLAYGLGAPDGFESIVTRGLLIASRLDNSVFTLSDKVFSISGDAPSSTIYEAAVAASQALPAGASLGKADIRPPEAKPYAWSATSDGVAATISGVTPTIEARRAIATAASQLLPGKMIEDKMQIARGAPAGDFSAATDFALAELGRLANGRVAISDTAISIVGEAGTSQAYDAAVTAAAKPPAGFSVARADIQAPEAKPFVWSAAVDKTSVRLGGLAPSGAIRDAIADAAAKAFPGKTISSDVGIARGAPDGDFTAMTGYALAELARFSSGEIRLTDKSLAISGEAATSEAYAAAVAAAKSPPAGMTIANADIQPPELKPYVWSAASDGASVKLSGAAPSEAARDAIAAAANKAFAGKTIVNEMQIARGAPGGDYAAFAGFALGELARLSSGKVGLTDQAFSISGEAPSRQVRDAVADTAKKPPAGLQVAAVDVQSQVIRPYVFDVDKTEGAVKLSGYAPDEKARQEILAAAKSAFFADTVTDDLKIGEGAPANFVNAAKSALPALARLATGKFALSDEGVRVDGAAAYEKAADQIKQALEAATPPGFKFNANVTVANAGAPLAASECQPRFDGLLSKGKILFETGSSNISRESAAVLDGLVGLAVRCQSADIEVGGHTDSVGAAAANLDLSRRRAEAVVAYLKDAGVDTTRIAAAGYGDTKPVASNDTAEGRAQNRRIEFIVK